MKSIKLKIHPNGWWEYRKKETGCFHNKNGPAVMFEPGVLRYYIDGELHRTDGPSIIDNQSKGYAYGIWYDINGLGCSESEYYIKVAK